MVVVVFPVCTQSDIAGQLELK